MYNGIGLPTPRGSGTNGYIERNLAHVKKNQSRPKIVNEPDQNINESRDMEIVNHERKRKIEAKCFKMRLQLEEDGLREEAIEREVNLYRQEELERLARFNERESREKK